MTDAEITALIEEVATLKKQVSDKDDVIAKLNDELTRLRNKVFGHTSENISLWIQPSSCCSTRRK